MRVNEAMSRDVRVANPQQRISEAAKMMAEIDAGALPVGENDRLVGMITDRDITVRSTAAGQAPETTRVGDVMSTDVRTCYSSQSVDEVLGQMGDVQIRRVPVVDQQSHSLVGIVSLGDMATKQSKGIEQALEEISSPSEPDRSQAH
jgi:CBS domain-containing protein